MTYDLVSQATRDVCYLYHELMPYGHLMEDLDFGGLYALPYWEFLDLTDTPADRLPPEEALFLRHGCLIIILTMSRQRIGGQGGLQDAQLDPCRTLVERLIPSDEAEVRLLETVKLGLSLVSKPPNERHNAHFEAECQWAFNQFVRGYFSAMASRGV